MLSVFVAKRCESKIAAVSDVMTHVHYDVFLVLLLENRCGFLVVEFGSQ